MQTTEFKLEPNEEKDICIVLKPEKRAAIHGVVKFPNGIPAQNAVVKLFKKVSCKECELEPVTFTFTDKCGQFLFGVESRVEYVLKVFFYKPECGDFKDDDCDTKRTINY